MRNQAATPSAYRCTLAAMFGVSRHRRSRRHHETEWRLDGTRWRAREELLAAALEQEQETRAIVQEQEVRAKLYSKPPATERTVEVLSPVEDVADQAA
jgi:hypothetical protein